MSPQDACRAAASLDRHANSFSLSLITPKNLSGNSHEWELTPALRKKLTIEAGSTISVTLLVRCGQLIFGGCVDAFGVPTTWSASLYDNTTSGTPIGGASNPASFNHADYVLETATITVTNDTTIPAGNQLILQVTNTTGADYGNYTNIEIEQFFNGDRSRIAMDVSTVINVDSVTAYAAAHPSTSQNPLYRQGATVYLRAVVSDPFGDYDIDPAIVGVAPTITIKDANGTTQVNATAMTVISQNPDPSDATKLFEYAYTVPAVPATGFWTASVTATEGNAAVDALYNGGTNITHTSNGSFEVQVPDLVLMKSVQVLSDPTGSATPHALPGAVLQYSINVSNQGQGHVDAGTVTLEDTLDSNMAFIVGSATFVDGATTSGLSFNPANDVEYCTGPGGATCPYTPGVGSGNPDPNITKVKFTPSGTFNGKANATAPAPDFTIRYKANLQ